MELEKVKEFLKNVNYLLTEEEVDALYEYAQKVPDNGIIVDIGTAAGGSAFIFTLASKPTVKVYTIDPLTNASFLVNREKLPQPKKLNFMYMTSERASEEFKDKKIDLLFVDGIHNYAGVTSDFNNFHPDDIVIFHDYFLYRDTIGKAVDDLVEKHQIEQIKIIDSLYHGEVRTGMYIAKC